LRGTIESGVLLVRIEDELGFLEEGCLVLVGDEE
jgi:hypothetical protein